MATLNSDRLITPEPEVADKLCILVERFGQGYGLRWQVWHQDDPIWQIWHEEVAFDKVIRRILQISAYAGAGVKPLLKTFALGQIIDERALVGRVLAAPRFLDQMPLDQVKDALSLRDFIGKSWTKVIEIQEKDFSTEGIKLPARSTKR